MFLKVAQGPCCPACHSTAFPRPLSIQHLSSLRYSVLPLVGDVQIKMYTFIWLLTASIFLFCGGEGMCSVWPISRKPFVVTVSHTLPECLRKGQGAGFTSRTELANHWTRCQGFGTSVSSIFAQGLNYFETLMASYIKKGPFQLSACTILAIFFPG